MSSKKGKTGRLLVFSVAEGEFKLLARKLNRLFQFDQGNVPLRMQHNFLYVGKDWSVTGDFLVQPSWEVSQANAVTRKWGCEVKSMVVSLGEFLR